MLSFDIKLTTSTIFEQMAETRDFYQDVFGFIFERWSVRVKNVIQKNIGTNGNT